METPWNWILKALKCRNEIYLRIQLKEQMGKWSHLSIYYVYLRVVVIKILKMTHFLYFLLVTDSKKLVTVWVKYSEYLTALERSYWVFSENGMVNRLWSYRLWDIEGRNIKKLLSQQKKTKSSIFKGWHLPNGNSEPNNS